MGRVPSEDERGVTRRPRTEGVPETRARMRVRTPDVGVLGVGVGSVK